MKKYCIFGGTFNPPHIAHSIIAEEVREKLNLDKIIFIPSGNPPLKNSIPAMHRFNMARAAFSGNKNFEVSDIEIINTDEKSYTVNTLLNLKEKYKDEGTELYFVIGSDNLIDLPRWKDPGIILELSKVVVIKRPGFNTENSPEEFRKKVIYVETPLLDISSSEIRQKVKEGKSIKYFVHPEVEEYIYKNNLYKY